MSTYWGYACVSHDPPLISERWFNWGQEILRDAYVRERAGAWPKDERPEVDLLDMPMPVVSRGGHETDAPIYWLREHPRCEIVLRSEYGDVLTLGETVVGSLGPRALTSG